MIVILAHTVVLVALTLLPPLPATSWLYGLCGVIGGALFLKASITFVRSPTRANGLANFHTSLWQLGLLLAIMALTLEHSLFGGGQAMAAIPGFSLDQLRRSSLATAAVARVLARQESVTEELGDEAFITGVLHDMGQLVLASGMPERYGEVGALAQSKGLAWHEAEQELLQTTHAEAGAYLLGLWGFPNPLVEAVLFHAAPGQAPTPGWGLPGLIHVSSSLAAHPEVADPDDPILGLEPGYLEGLGLKGRWPAWQEACKAALGGSVGPCERENPLRG